MRIKKITRFPYKGKVFDLTVKNTHTYNIEGMAVHNSSGGVLICYLLGITHVDPIKWDLSLDRFLTKDRINSGKWPDIDTDLGSREIISGKDGTYGYLHERFGKDHVAQISTIGTLRLKSSIKDVNRAMNGEVSKEIHALTKRMGDAPQGLPDNDFVFGYDANGDWVKGAVDTDPILKEYISKYPNEWEIVKKCLSLQKSTGIHAAAYVIGSEPISNFIPTQVRDGITITQWAKDDVEAAGGVKIDYLVINILNDIAKCVKLIQNNDPVYEKDFVLNGIKVPGFRVLPVENHQYADIWDLPERKEVFKDIYDTKLETVFQLDTEGAKKWSKAFHFIDESGNYGLNSIYDMAAFTALDRPGTLDAYVDNGSIRRNMLEEFASRKKGDNSIGEIPEVTAISPKTYGVLCFQEGCSKVFKEIGKTTGIEAEAFRSHTSKKDTPKVLKDKEIFMRGAVDTVGLEKAEAIWSQLVTASNYNFCIDGDQEIQTKTGNKKISDITTQDEVAYFDFDNNQIKYENPTKVWKSGEKEVFETPINGHGKVSTTIDHSFWSFQSGKYEWKEIGETNYICVLKGTMDGVVPVPFGTGERFSLGIRSVYDMSMPSRHNFILANGSIAHNCLAHSVEYAITGYVTAYLKHFFPLQWWAAVLSNSNRNEIQEKFWSHCQNMILLPDIKYSKADFTIEGDKLRAPLWLLEGIGEKAHNELVEIGPFNDIRDFVQKVEDRRIRLGTKIEVEIKPKKSKSKQIELFGPPATPPIMEESIKKASSAINRTVVYNLIMSGVADDLFPKDTDVLTKLQTFETIKAEICQQKPTSIDQKFLNFNALDRYMYRKQLMPYFSGSVLPILVELKYKDISRNKEKGMYTYKDTYPFVTPQYLAALEKLPFLASKATVALAAIVTETRVFTYQSNKEACEFHLDVGGTQLKLVKWPDYKTGKLDKFYKSDLTKSLAIVIVGKSKLGKDPVLEELTVIKEPHNPKEETLNG